LPLICPLSPAHLAGLTAFQLWVLLLFVAPALAPWPLAAFVLSCAVAPFFPRFSYFLPIVGRGDKGQRRVALTFDDGPDPAVTPQLLDLLDRHGAQAAFFMTGENAARHPEVVRDVLARGHEICNHSQRHDPFLMLRGSDVLRREVADAQAAFAAFGVAPLAFRPPVGITNSRLWPVLLDLGMFCVNYSCRALDVGNRRIEGLAGRALRTVGPGDIVALHDVTPRGGDVPKLLSEFDALLRGLKARDLAVVPLSRLIRREVMARAASAGEANPAARFYDGLADRYDEEQFCSAVSISRRAEQKLFAERLPALFDPSSRVLEIGAGTGIFTLEIARRCREVVAVDISAGMLAQLERKAAEAGLPNIRTLAGNAETVALDGVFDGACAFLVLEYIADLPAFFRRLAPFIRPGGTLYFTTARRSFFRFFTQIGNAMRQGMWLKARSRREVERMLSEAGFGRIEVQSRLLKSVVSGGMLLEVSARRNGDGPGGGG
jgi:peptidoglycan/xylan/chitin deacetylase (PgdA/CDA1 family)/ubiquinone/menaquinone biosynthesis C-methylase UbiE